MKKAFKSIIVVTLLLCVAIAFACFAACGGNTPDVPPQHEHSYVEKIIAPTCTEKGYTEHICACGEKYADNYVDALGHDFTDYVSDNNATYETDGTKSAKCNHTGCTATDTVTDVDSKLQSSISFKTLTVDGNKVFGKVSNSTESFSFIDEVKAEEKMKFIVSRDIYGSQTVITKTIELAVGDNKVYVIEMLDGEPKSIYEVVVRRRPMYTVSFNTNGGTTVEEQIIEEDACAIEPISTKTGYTFDAWSYDFNAPVTNNTTITASWKANTDTEYKVEYYLQNLENDYYTLETTENKTGTSDTTATAEIKTFEHFTYNPSGADSGNIAPDGSTILKVYYTRDKYTITFDANGGTLKNGNTTQTVKYGGSVVVPTYERTGYTFTGFDKPLTNITESQTIKAQWKINQYTLTIVYNNGQKDKIIPQDYDTAIASEANPTRIGYTFVGWDKTIPTKMPAKNITVTAQWKINQYTLTIVYGNGQKDNVVTQDYDTTIASEANPLREGYIFNGWDKTIPAKMPAENITITAQWLAIFTSNGETITGLTSYGETLNVIIIPSKMDNVEISAIGEYAFA